MKLVNLCARLIFIAAVINCASCTTSSQTELTQVQATVINGLDDSPLPGIKVDLLETETPKEAFSDVIVKVIASENSAQNGAVEFEVESLKSDRFDYSIKVDYSNIDDFALPGYEGVEVSDDLVVEKGENTETQLRLFPAAGLRIKVDNTDPTDQNDRIQVYVVNAFGDYKLVDYTGTSTYQTQTYSKVLAGSCELKWEVTRGGEMEVSTEPLILDHGEKRELTVEY